MTATAIALLTCLPQLGVQPAQPHIEQGYAFRYSPHVMERVARKRGLVLPVGYNGWSSTQDCKAIGKTFYVRARGRVYRTMQADCSQPAHVAVQRARKLVIELDYNLAARIGFISDGKIWVEIWREP